MQQLCTAFFSPWHMFFWSKNVVLACRIWFCFLSLQLKNRPWRLPCTGKRFYLPVKAYERYGIKWGGKSYSLFLNLWKYVVPHLLCFPSLAELSHLVCFCPIESMQKIVLSIPVIFLFTFFCIKSVGLLLTVFVLAREPREALSGRQLLKQEPGTLGRERSSFNFPCQPFHFNFFLSAL